MKSSVEVGEQGEARVCGLLADAINMDGEYVELERRIKDRALPESKENCSCPPG